MLNKDNIDPRIGKVYNLDGITLGVLARISEDTAEFIIEDNLGGYFPEGPEGYYPFAIAQGELFSMNTIDKIIDFAEQIAIEDDAKMKKLDAWDKYIKPLFKEHTGYNFDLSYVSMYRKEWKQWLNIKREEFDRTYCA